MYPTQSVGLNFKGSHCCHVWHCTVHSYWPTDESFDSRQWHETLLRNVDWLLCPPSLGAGEVLSSWVKRPRREGDHSPLSAEIKSSAIPPPIRLQGVGMNFLSHAFALIPRRANWLRHVCMSTAWISAAPTGQIFVECDIGDIYKSLSSKYRCGENGTKKLGTLHV